MADLHSDSKAALNEINAITRERNHKKIVFVSGNFNIIHPGHLRVLRFAAESGDFLVVGVYSDQTGKSIIPEALRQEAVSHISWVGFSFVLRDPPEEFIRELKPAIVVKGKEHEKKYNPELEVLKSISGKLLFGSGDVSFSSLDLLKKQYEFNISTIQKPLEFLDRHHFSMPDLRLAVNKMSNLRVHVFGDSIVDTYITCDPIGMSQEDPTIVVTPVLEERFVGGAAIVAAHAAGLGASVHFFSVSGRDEAAGYLREALEGYGVNCTLAEDESRPTTLKQRFRAREKTLLRVSHLRQHDIARDIQEKILADFLAAPRPDLVIFSDFNYGMLPQSLVDAIIEICREKKIRMVADSQSSSQIGDVSRFKGMSILTPTEREARLAVRDYNSGMVVLAESLRQMAMAENVLITMGAEGLLIHAANGKDDWFTDRLPAFNTAPRDISGAGDSLLTAASLALTLGCDIWQSAYIGSLAAACQVGRLGNLPLTTGDLIAEIDL